MTLRPYLTFPGTCAEAIALYKEAFQTDTTELMRFGDLPQSPDAPLLEGYKDWILQAVLPIGDCLLRLSDCAPGHTLNDPESERIAMAVEASATAVSDAFYVLAREGRVGIPLEETFYSPLAGVVFDKFGVMWNFIGVSE